LEEVRDTSEEKLGDEPFQINQTKAKIGRHHAEKGATQATRSTPPIYLLLMTDQSERSVMQRLDYCGGS